MFGIIKSKIVQTLGNFRFFLGTLGFAFVLVVYLQLFGSETEILIGCALLFLIGLYTAFVDRLVVAARKDRAGS